MAEIIALTSIPLTAYATYLTIKFAIKMTNRISSNFNMYGHRIISLYNGGDNQTFIKTVCIRHFLSKMFGFEDANFNKQTHLQDFKGGMITGSNTLIGYTSKDFNTKLERIKGKSNEELKKVLDTCTTLLNTPFTDKEPFYLAMTSCEINLGVLVMNERKHPKLHIYNSESPGNRWLLIVDEKQEANMKNMGVVTSNTKLLATSDEILESDFTFSSEKFTDMMNKYKVEVVSGSHSDLKLNYLDMYKPKDMPTKELTAFDTLKHHVGQKVRRVARVGRILRDDEVSVTRTRTFTKVKKHAAAAEEKKKERSISRSLSLQPRKISSDKAGNTPPHQ